jgi:hypothetical protein
MGLFDGVIIWDQTLWLVCGLFYIFDNIQFCEPRKLVLIEGLNGQWAPIFPMPGYRFCHRPIVILNLFSPWLAAIQMQWLTNGAFEPQNLRRSRRLLRAYQRRVDALRVTSAFMFMLLFIIAPLCTYKFGLMYGILLALPLHIAAILWLTGLLICDRHFWEMSWFKIARLVFECAVCPGVFVNVCRKVTLAHTRVSGDAMAYTIVHGGNQIVNDIRRQFELIVEEAQENGDVQCLDEQLIEEYRLHLA